MSSTKTSWILELVDKVTKPLRNITNFGNKARRSVSGVNRMLDRVNSKSRVLSSNLKRMSVAGLAFGVLSLGSFNFAHSMARANTMAQVGAKEFKNYSNSIRGIAEVVPLAKTQLSEGLFATVSAGVPKNNWINFLKDSSKSAYAGTAELGTVVDTTASIIKSYGAEWSTAIDVQDRLQKTIELGQIPSLQSLASALPRVTALSAKLKISQEELFGTFATASGVMGKPAEVATQLNAVLSALLKPGAEATKMADKLGIAFDAKSITRAGGLKNYIDELMPKIEQYAQVSGKTQESIIGDLFGSQEAIKMVIGLGGKLSQSWQVNTNKIANATGSVNKAFTTMQATAKSQSILMKNSMSNAMDGIVDTIEPLTIGLFKVIGKVANLVSGFIKANPNLSRFIILGTAIFGTLLFVTTALVFASLRIKAYRIGLEKTILESKGFERANAKAARWVMNLGKNLWRNIQLLGVAAFKYAIAGASLLGSFVVGLVSATAAQFGLNIALNANPIGLIVIGIAAAIAIIVVMIKYWDKITEGVYSFGKAIVNFIDGIFPGFKNAIKVGMALIKNLVLGVWESIKEVWASIKNFFGFGDTTEIKVSADVKKLKDEEEKELKKQLGTDPLIQDKNNLNANAKAVVGGNNTASNGSGKTMTMTLNITNNFKVGANVRESIDNIADKVVGRIADRLRDAEIALG